MKGITLNKNALAYCLYGEGFTPEDLPNSITKVAELEQVIQTFENAKMCQGVCIVNNSRITQNFLRPTHAIKKCKAETFGSLTSAKILSMLQSKKNLKQSKDVATVIS